MTDSNAPVALITGSSQRIGAAVARHLHAQGYNIVIHCHRSVAQAEMICAQLNAQRENSCRWLCADLNQHDDVMKLADFALACWSRMDVLINNASSYFPTPLGSATDSQWNELFGSNLKAPFFLSQALVPALKKSQGVIINMCDVHAIRPLINHTIYCAAKAGLIMLTQALAKDLAPLVRVNGIAPGAILWPNSAGQAESQSTSAMSSQQAEKIAAIPLEKIGEPSDIVKAIWFLIHDAPYITGQILPIDGGRTLIQ
jgi:pteridine reductase